jgi:hypothetical protein
VVGHFAPPGVPLTEPSPYGTTGAEFQQIVALRNLGFPVLLVSGLGANAEAAWALRAATGKPSGRHSIMTLGAG